MIQYTYDFNNELNNHITITVCSDERGITISALGPTSQVEHTWTRMEAAVIAKRLELVLKADKDESS